MNKLQQQLEAKDLKGKQAAGVGVVYVGDSVTDLLALLKADVGIVVGNSATLRTVAAAYKVELRPLGLFLSAPGSICSSLQASFLRSLSRSVYARIVSICLVRSIHPNSQTRHSTPYIPTPTLTLNLSCLVTCVARLLQSEHWRGRGARRACSTPPQIGMTSLQLCMALDLRP